MQNKSFLDYYLDRSHGIITPLSEMTRPRQKWGSEIRKAPIFMDDAAINFLYQFPPQFWGQALAIRDGDLIYHQSKALEEGSEGLEDIQDMWMNDRGKVRFPKRDTGVNAWYNSLTSDVDDNILSQLGKGEEHRTQYQQHAQQNNKGYYGFDANEFKKSKKNSDLAVAHGFIKKTKGLARKRLWSLINAIKQGWYGEIPEEQMKSVNFGGKDVKCATYTLEELKQLPGFGKYFGALKDGRAYWIGYRPRKSGEPVKADYYSYMPVLKPSVMVRSEAVESFDMATRLKNRIKEDLANNQLELYEKASNQTGRETYIDRRTAELETWLEKNKKPPKGDWPAKQAREFRKELERLQDTIYIVNSIQRELEEQGKDKNIIQNRDALVPLLQQFANQQHINAKRTQDEAERFDLHAWNVHHFNPTLDNLHTSATGFGTTNVNWQQKETVFGFLLELKIDPAEFWETVRPYIASGAEDGDEPVCKRVGSRNWRQSPLAQGINGYLSRPSVYGTIAWYAIIKNWWSVFKCSSNYLRGFMQPRWFMPFAKLFKEFKEGKIKDRTALLRAFDRMDNGAMSRGRNYAGMVFQLRNRMDPKDAAQGEESPQPSKFDLNSIFDNPQVDDALSKAAAGIVNSVASKWNRKIRPYDPGFSQHKDWGKTGHSIEILQQIIASEDDSVDNAVSGQDFVAKQAISKAPSQEEQEMTKNIVDTGLAFQLYRLIYAWAKKQAGEDWNLADANAWASKAVDKFLEKRGIRPYGGNIQPTKGPKSAAKRSRNNKEQKEKIDKQLTLFDKQQEPPAMAAKTQAKGTVLPAVGDVSPEQADQYRQYLEKLTQYINHPQVLQMLNKKSAVFDPKKREYYEKYIQDKQIGWQLVQQALAKLDK